MADLSAAMMNMGGHSLTDFVRMIHLSMYAWPVLWTVVVLDAHTCNGQWSVHVNLVSCASTPFRHPFRQSQTSLVVHVNMQIGVDYVDW